MSMKTISIFLAVVSAILSQRTVSAQGFVDPSNASSSSSFFSPDLDNVMQSLVLPVSSSSAKTDTKPRSSSGGVPDLDAVVRASTTPEVGQSMSAGRHSMGAGSVGTENNRRLTGGGLRRGSPIGAFMGPGFGRMSSDFMSVGGGLSRMIGGNLGRGLTGRPNIVVAETRRGIGSAINNNMHRDFMMGASMGQGVEFGMGSNRAINGGVGTFGNDLSDSFNTGRIGDQRFSGSDMVGRSVHTSGGRNNDAIDRGMETSVSNENDNTGARTDRRELGSGMSRIPGLMDGMMPGSMGGMMPGSIEGMMPGSMGGMTPGSMGGMMPGSMGGMVSESMGRMTSGSVGGMTSGLMGGMTPGSMGGMTPRTLGGLVPSAMGGMPGAMGGMMSGSMGGITPGSMGGLMSGSFVYPSFGGIGIDPRVTGRFDNSALTGDAIGFLGSDIGMSSDVFNLSRSFGSGFDGRIGSGLTGGMGGTMSGISGMGGMTGLSPLMIDPRFMSLMGSGMMTPELLGSSGMIHSRYTGVSPFSLVSGMPGDFGPIGGSASGAFGTRMSPRFAGIGGTSGGISDFMYPFSMTSFPVTGTPLPFFGTSMGSASDSSSEIGRAVMSGRLF